MELQQPAPSSRRSLQKRSNMYKDREIGGFKVVSGGLVVPQKWWGSLFAWALIIIPSVVQIAVVNSKYAW